jgi:hypothetical protein
MPKTRRNKKRNSTKRRRNNTRRRGVEGRGGGCGCGPKFMGGSAYLSAVPTTLYYPYNSNLTNDPQNPAAVGSGRFMGDYSRMSGGKRNKKRRGRKMRGGSNFFSTLYNNFSNSGSGMNYIHSFGALNGGVNQSALITGTGGVVNGSATSQPVTEQPYGHHNPPLV